jgi:hypothetical protein
MNWIHNEQQQKINHILQHGVSFWDNATEYVVGDLVNLNGVVYKALISNYSSTPVAGGNSTWAVYQKSIVAASGALTVQNNNQSNVSTVDVSGSGLVSKFDNSETVVWTASGSKAKAKAQSKQYYFDSGSFTLTDEHNGATILLETLTAPLTITLPVSATSDPYYQVKFVVGGRGTGTLGTQGKITFQSSNGTDILIRLLEKKTNTDPWFFYGSSSSSFIVRNNSAVTPNSWDINGVLPSNGTKDYSATASLGSHAIHWYLRPDGLLEQWCSSLTLLQSGATVTLPLEYSGTFSIYCNENFQSENIPTVTSPMYLSSNTFIMYCFNLVSGTQRNETNPTFRTLGYPIFPLNII